MSAASTLLDRCLFPGVEEFWDDDLLRNLVLSHLKPEHKVLDLGAGAGHVRQMNFRGLARHVSGIDPDERVLVNPFLDDAHVGHGEKIPFDDATFDLVVSDNVFEHLENPLAVLHEVSRVLKGGGRFIAKTPNAWHYVPLISRCTPFWFHRFANRRRGRDETHTFETWYRANTRSSIRRLARQCGLAVHSMELVESRPEYLRFTAPAYILGWLYCRIVNSLSFLECLRVVILLVLEKPSAPPPAESPGV